MTELAVAEKLGYTLVELRERLTEEELLLWVTFFNVRNQMEQEQQRRTMRRR